MNNMALVHNATGKPAEALALYEQALPISRAVGDRVNEARVLLNMSFLVDDVRALKLVRQARDILREIQSPNEERAEKRLAALGG